MKFLLSFLLLYNIFFHTVLANDLNPYSDFKTSQNKCEWDLFKTNKVKIKTTYRIDNSTENSSKEVRWIVSKEYFDDNGKLIRYESVNDDNILSFKIDYTYNMEGLLNSVVETDNENQILQKKVLSYDPFGKVKKIQITGLNDVKIQSHEFEYIEQKKLVIETFKNNKDSIQSYFVHLYDKSFNRIIKTTQFDKENKIDGTTIIHYIDKGINSREVYKKDIDEPYLIKYQNYYNEVGKLSEVRNISYPDKLLVTVLNTYNDKNLITRTKMIDPGGNMITTLEFEYSFY